MAAGGNSFEGSSDGTTITEANSGGGSGDACYEVVIGASCLLEFDSAQARETLSAHYLMPASAAGTRMEWREDIGTGDCWYAIDYYKTSHPGGTFWYLLRINQNTTADPRACGIAITSGGLIRFDDAAGASVSGMTSTSVVPNDQWVRIELRANQTAGTAEWWYYADVSSDTATETQSGSSIDLGTFSFFEVATGAISGVANMNSKEWWVDNVRWSNEGKLGPATPAAVAPPLRSVRSSLRW